MDRVLGQWRSSLGRSVKVMGASYDTNATKIGSWAPGNLTPGGALSSTYLSLRWSPWTSGGADSSRATNDGMPKQWRVEWTPLAGCGRRSPPLGASTRDRLLRCEQSCSQLAFASVSRVKALIILSTGMLLVGEPILVVRYRQSGEIFPF